jgi:hypothetical protein
MAAPDGASNTPSASAAEETTIIITPEDLVEAFKSSGGFDVLRASILKSFMDSVCFTLPKPFSCLHAADATHSAYPALLLSM